MYLPTLSSSSNVSSRTTITPTGLDQGQGQEHRTYLTAHYDLTLILTSYLVSALGGYTATQLMTQVVTTKSLRARIFWVTLASLAFGGCSIWCLHFIAMIAMHLPLPIHYDPFSTFFSAVVAIVATWLTFGYEFIQLFLYRRRLLDRRRARNRVKREEREEVKKRRDREVERRGRGRTGGRRERGGEEERRGLIEPGLGHAPDELDGRRPDSTSTTAPAPTINITLDPTADLQEDDDEETGGEDDHNNNNNNDQTAGPQDERLAPKKFKAPSGWNGEETSGMISPRSVVGPDYNPMIRLDSLASSSSPDGNIQRRTWSGFNPSDEDLSRTRESTIRPGSSSSRQGSGPTAATEYDISPHDYAPHNEDDRDRQLNRSYSHRSESLTTTFSNTSTESLPSLSSSRDYRYSTTEDGSRSMSMTSRASTGNSIANDPTISTAAVQAYAGGAMSLRMRELAHSKPRSISLMWKEIFQDLKSGINRKVLIKGTLLGSSAFCMHYEGMRSMRMGHGIAGLTGGVEWSWTWVGVSWVIACAASIVAVVFMPLSKMDFRRQVAFALIASAAIEAMHWSGMFAATFYVVAGPDYPGPFLPDVSPPTLDVASLPGSGTPHGLAISVILVGFITCMLSYVLLARSVTQSRDELVAAIHTKRTLWRVMAEREAAVRADKQKTEFIAVASHEIRTPLHVISGYADLLDKTSLTSEQTECVKFILAGCESIRLITTDVLDFSKLQQPDAESKARSESINIRDLAKGIARGCSTPHFRRASADKLMDLDKLFPIQHQQGAGHSPKVEVILDIEEDVPSVVWGDKVYLTRVIMNLINNALKFTSQGYVLVKLQVQPPESLNGRLKLVISVRDTGIGIASHLRAAVFAPFRQADTSHTRSHAGTGLGLAICHQLAIRMKGRLGIWSSQGPEDRGTEISLLLPFEGGLHGEAAVLGPSGSRMINEAPTIFDLPLTERSEEAARDRTDTKRARVGLALRQVELENVFRKACLTAGFDVVSLDQQGHGGTQADHLWIDLENVRRLLDPIGTFRIPPTTTLFLLCDNVHATAADSSFLGLFSSIQNDIVCMPRPAVIQDVLHCLVNPDLAGSCGGVRLGASDRLPAPKPRATPAITTNGHGHGHAASGLHLDGISIGADQTKFKVDSPADATSGLQSPPLVGLTETQSMVAALLPTVTSAPTSAQNSKDTKMKPLAGPPKPGSVVLLVDDNMVNQKLGAKLISKLKHPVETAGNGQVAIDMILQDRGKYGLVLMDCQMPVMDGFEATRRIRKLERKGTLTGPRLAIVALTANVSEECRTSCFDAGADHFLEKPLDMAKLKEYTGRYVVSGASGITATGG